MKCVIHTFSGKDINPLDLQMDDICIEDIAHALALCNRFAGHTKQPISVAQHSVYVSKLCDINYKDNVCLQGLLHDASEAYLGDITKWLKQTDEMKAFREAENRVQKTIFQKFNIDFLFHNDEIRLYLEVEAADRLMVQFEGRMGFGESWQINHPRYPPLTTEEIERVGFWFPWSWEVAEKEFLKRFKELT